MERRREAVEQSELREGKWRSERKEQQEKRVEV